MNREHNMKILNLDKLLPEPKVIILSGKTLTFEKIPSKFTLGFTKLKEGDKTELLLNLLVDLLKIKDPEITVEWVEENCSLDDISSIVNYMFGVSEGNDEKKNPDEEVK